MTTTGGSSSSSSSSDGAAMTSPVSPSIPRRHSLNPAAAAAAQGGGGGGGESPFLRRASVGGALLLAPPPVVDSATVGMGDDSVEQTNDDATLCKKSAVRYGYWRDPYLEHMAPKLTERKPPEIHLGYYTRVTALRRLLDKAMEVCCEKASGGVQIINLGAGFDTLYWRLKDDLEASEQHGRLKNFVEIDFPGVTAKKCFAVKRTKALLEKVAGEDGEVRLSRTDLHGYDYHVVAADLGNFPRLEAKLEDCGIDFSAPTIFLAECVLVYMTPKATEEFLSSLTRRFSSSLVFLDHEQVNMGDRFGAVMLENLAARGCGLAGAESCRSKQTQTKRFPQAGWDGARCWTMNEAYSLLPREDVERVEKLELFDERELMNQLFEHYCLTVAWRNGGGVSFEELGDSWL